MLGRENAEVLLAWLDRRLAASEAARIEWHAERCPDCRSVLEAQRAVWSALDHWEPEAAASSFNRKLYQAIDRDRARPWWDRALDPILRPALPLRWTSAGPAAAAVLVAGILLVSPGFDTTAAPDENATLDAEQIETVLGDLEVLRTLELELRAESDAPGRGSGDGEPDSLPPARDSEAAGRSQDRTL
jgi:hypothetical protein